MSTHSVIAVPQGDGWIGTYCHWDGQPSHIAKALITIVRRDGLEQARKALVADRPGGWSSIRPENNEPIEGYVVVEGYGTVVEGGQYDEPEIYSSDDKGIPASYVYVLAPHGLICVVDGEHVAVLPYDTIPPSELLTTVECGENFERCDHYAWVHFPEADGLRVGTSTWLGREDPSFSEATVVKYNGQHWKLTGSGSQGTAQSSRWQDACDSSVRYWWASAEYGGRRQNIRIARLVKGGYKLEHDLEVELRNARCILKAGTVTQ